MRTENHLLSHPKNAWRKYRGCRLSWKKKKKHTIGPLMKPFFFTAATHESILRPLDGCCVKVSSHSWIGGSRKIGGLSSRRAEKFLKISCDTHLWNTHESLMSHSWKYFQTFLVEFNKWFWKVVPIKIVFNQLQTHIHKHTTHKHSQL